jgi:hypothetical protein
MAAAIPAQTWDEPGFRGCYPERLSLEACQFNRSIRYKRAPMVAKGSQ